MSMQSQNRRDFVKRSAGLAVAATTPYFFSSPKSFADELKSSNDRPRMGLIGAGGMGMGNMWAAKDMCDVVAIADVDAGRARRANKELSSGKADVYADYERILERDDLDALHIASPDHWHAKQLIEALLSGKDVYCEKPLTLTVEEGKWINKVVKETGRIVQVGTQQRSTFDLFVKAIALVAEGRLGKIKKIQAAIGWGPDSPSIPLAEVPKQLDWNKWLGPAPYVEYRSLKQKDHVFSNGHFEFRWWYAFSGGKLTDWGAHHVDIAMWALEANGQLAAPTSISGTAEHPVPFENGDPTQPDRYNTARSFNFKVDFPTGVELVIRNDTDNGVLIEGDKGRIFVNRGKLVGKPVEELAENPLPEDAMSKAYKGMPMEDNERKAQWLNFFYSVKERKQPISDVASHVRALDICHLAAICGRLGRKINWDGSTGSIPGDEQANAMLSRPYRQGFEIRI